MRELAADDPVLAHLTESLLAVIEVMTKEADELTKRVLDEVRVEPTCRRLMTVPGCWRTSRADTTALPIWRDRRAGPHQPMRR